VFEIKNDAIMRRTSQRPLPSGRITVPHAVGWASSVGLAGTALLATQVVNLLTSLIVCFSCLNLKPQMFFSQNALCALRCGTNIVAL
jgi:heme O synthase-like polyprenyltransferase